MIDVLNFTIFKKITDRTCLSTRSLVSNYTDTFKFVVDDVLKKLKNSKLKGFSFYKGKVIEVVVRIGSSLHFHRERFVPFHFSSKNSDRVHEHFNLVEVIM